MSKTKVTTFVGTRPEIIRLACVIEKFDELFEHRLIHTGQNPDPLLRDVFLKELRVRNPDQFFKDNHESLGSFLANLLIETERELIENRPDAILILGDTNSALSAIIAKRMGIPIYHLEAGNRSFDSNVPEEINRRIVDHIADMNFPYSELARANLISEGIHPRKLSLMGPPLPEVVLSDSGTVSEESIILGFPALTIRDSMERPEALEAGSIIMCGISSDEVLEAIEFLEKSERSNVPPMEYQFPDTSTRVANVLVSTVHRQAFWNGLRKI